MSKHSVPPPLFIRPYEIILFGASGYTGRWCAEHVAIQLPTDLTWAVAGRSHSKLQAVVDDTKRLNPDRKPPSVQLCSLDSPADISALAQNTRLVVNCVGPYSLYSEAVLKACVENGTSYIDTTGEVPWVARMIAKYHGKAKETGAVIIPQCGFESAAADMLVYCVVTALRKQLGIGASHTIGALYDMKVTASGETLATVFALFDTFPRNELAAVERPFALSPVPHHAPISAPKGIMQTVTGPADAAIVHRSWGLQDAGAYYGERFTSAEYVSVQSRLLAVALNVGITLGLIFIALPPVRWLAKKFMFTPGEGLTREQANKGHLELRVVAEADDGSERKVSSKLVWKGSTYQITGVFTMEAAVVLLRDQPKAKEMGGGLLTPACLGEIYVDRLKRAGVYLEADNLS